jgi:hypothetical protein
MHGESYASEVNSNYDIDNFLTQTDIFRSQAIVPHNE